MLNTALAQAVALCFFPNFKQSFQVPATGLMEASSLANLMGAVLVSGLVSTCLTYPLDTVRARMALSHRATGKGYSGLFNCLSTTVKRKNFKALYAGFWLGVAYNQLWFLGIVGLLENPPLPVEFLVPIVGLTVYPIDLIRRKLQVNDLGRCTRFSSPREAIRHTMSTAGLRGLMAGAVGYMWLAGLSISLAKAARKEAEQRLWIV